MDRLDRYREVAEQLIRDGKAYYCYATKKELEAVREAQRARRPRTCMGVTGDQRFRE